MNFVELFLNEPPTTKLDLNQQFDIALQYSIADIRDITKRNAAFSKTILLPGTKNNNYWMGNLFDVNVDFTMFNPNRKTPCSISVNSEIVMKGFLQLRKIKKLLNVDAQGNEIYYEVVVFNNAVDLMTELGEKTLQGLDLSELEHTYSYNNVVYSWTQSWTNGWVYPMYGDTQKNNQYKVTDFYPAFYSRYIIDRIFQEAGFGWTGSLKTNTQFQREIIPFVGSGSQSLSEDTVAEQDFRVGNTQSFTYSPPEFLLNPVNNSSGCVFDSVNTAFIPSWTYSFPVDNYQDAIYPQNNYFDNGATFNTSTSVWTTTVNRAWSPQFQGNYDLELNNPSADFISVIPYYGINSPNSSNPPQTTTLDIRHILEYKLPATTQWVFWAEDLERRDGWFRTNPSGWNPGLTLSETITPSFQAPQLFLPIGTQIRVRVVVKPCSGGGPAPFNQNVSFIAAYKYGTIQPRKLRMTIKYNTSPQNFLFSNGVVGAAQENDPIVPSTWISSKLKQKDFISDLIKRYNLYIQVDPTNERILILDTRTDFYNKTLNLDWTDKKDFASQDEITLLAELQFKEMLFTMKADTDKFNKDYQDLVGDIYGQYKYVFQNDFVKSQQKVESPFSPTPLFKTSWGAVLPAISPDEPKVNSRVLYWGGLITPPQANFTWQLQGQTTTSFFTKYPYAGHFDDPFNATLDIHFGTPKYIYNGFTNTIPTETMYETYWSDYVSQIEDGKLVSSKFYLDEFDIRTIKDNFWAKIFVLDSYYYVNKIIDYKPMQNTLTQVELIKIKDGFPPKKKGGKTASIARPMVAIKETQPTPNFGYSNAVSVDALVVGKGNITGGKVVGGSVSNTFKNIIVGDDNAVGGLKSGVIGGDGNKISGSGNIAIQTNNVELTGENVFVLARENTIIEDTSSAYLGTGIKGDLATKRSLKYDNFQRGVNLSLEGYDLGQADWRIIPSDKEVVVQSGKESRPKDLTILGHLDIEDITGTYSFGSQTFYKQGLVEVEDTLNIDGLLTVGGELWVGRYDAVSDGGATTSTGGGSQSLAQTLAIGNTTGTYSMGVLLYQQFNPVINTSVSGTFTQSLTTNTFIYTLTGNTTFNYSGATYSNYNFVVRAGTYSFTLNSAGAWQTVGATALGFTGSFIMSGIYDGTDMWITTVRNYQSF